jgi:ThiF family
VSDLCCDIVISANDHATLMAHLFPGDRDEHGAILHAGVAEDDGRMKLLIRGVFPAAFGTDYVAGQHGYRALHPRFIHQHITACRDQGLAYLAVHNHDCGDRVGFSGIDMASHERGYPALLDIGKGVPVGALVIGRQSMEADVWTSDGRRRSLREARIVGSTLRRLYPSPRAVLASPSESHDRQVRMFGVRGHARLTAARVAVIGLGGIGSLVSEYLARLGVGEIITIDPDRLEVSNLSRVVGATLTDAHEGCSKVAIAKRHAAEASTTRITILEADVAIESVAHQVRGCDYIFLAADSMRARLVFNALVHQYLIPGVQLGAKVRADADGVLLDVMSAVRPVRPGEGCLWCNQLIDPHQLALEAKSDAERQAQAYGVAEPNPSVITLNAVAAAHAVNDFLFFFLDLPIESAPLAYRHFHFLEGTAKQVQPRKDDECRECGRSGRYARGDAMPLPCVEG